MTDLGDLLGLPPARRPARSRRPCRECYRAVYVDQMICGLGRCCAEQQGLIVRRWHLTAPDPTAPTLFDRPEDLMMEPFPQIRIDLAGLPADEAHARILAHHDAMSTVNPFIAEAIPGLAEATQEHLRGQRNILARHAPRHAVIVPLDAPHAIPDVCQHHATTWPCDDYRDAAAGLATGLPGPVNSPSLTTTTRAETPEQFTDRYRQFAAAFADRALFDGSADADSIDFPGAVLALGRGFHLTRTGWNRSGQYVVMQAGYPDGVEINANTAAATGLPEGTRCSFRPYFMLHTARAAGEMHTFVPWVPSVSDVLADDWLIVA